jgi:Anti-sigma-K factor rskA
MTCDEFRRSYLEHVVPAAAEEHLRGCSDCQRVTPELDLLRARLGDPAVWEAPGADLRLQVVGAVVSAAHPQRPSRWSRGRWWMAGGAAALVLAVVVASLVVIQTPADGADWELSLYTKTASPDAVVLVHGWNTDTGTHLQVDVDGLAPAGPNEYYAIWMTSVDGRHVPAGTFTESGRIEAWSGVKRSDFPRIWITLEPADGDERLTGTTVADTPGW